MPEPNPLKRSQAQYSDPKILVFGSVAVDLACNYMPPRGVASTDGSVPDLNASPRLLTSNIASIEPSIGGVGHNVALAAHRVSEEQDVRLCSIVADDIAGKSVLTEIKQEGMDSSGIVVIPSKNDDATTNRTAQYVAVNDGNKNLVMAMADMALLSGNAYEPYLRNSLAAKNASWIVADANWNHEIFRKIISTSKQSGAKIAFEPVSVAKSAATFPQSSSSRTKLGIFPSHSIDLATPNQHELAAMHASAKQHEYFESDSWWKAIDALGIPSSGARDRFVSLTSRKLTDEGIPLQSIQLLPIIPIILTKLGPDGVLLTSLLRTDDPRLRDPDSAAFILSRNTNGDDEIGGVYMRLFPAIEKVQEVVSVNGVGDTFLGVLIAGLARGCALDEHLIGIAQKGAVMTLKSSASVSPELGVLKEELQALEVTGR